MIYEAINLGVIMYDHVMDSMNLGFCLYNFKLSIYSNVGCSSHASAVSVQNVSCSFESLYPLSFITFLLSRQEVCH